MTAQNQWASGQGFARPKPAQTPETATATVSNLHYRLDNEEWAKVWAELKPTEIQVLYHLRTLAPFADRVLEIGVRQLAKTLNVAHSTVSRALKVLEEKGYIDMELVQVNVRVKSNPVPSDTSGASTHHPRSPRTTDDHHAPPLDETTEAETLIESAPDTFSTDASFVPEHTLKNFVKNRTGLETVEINSERTGTLLKRLIEEAGISLNAALISVLENLERMHPEDAYSRVTNAVSAYLEQKATVRNPQGFISAALRRGFTSNSAKRASRNKKEEQKRTNLPPALKLPVLPKVVDLSGLVAEIQIHCERLELTVKEALERFGRPGRSLHDLNDIDLATLRGEMAGWV